jgi:hypothetical protein
MMYNKMSKVCNNENCKGNPLTVMVTASPTAGSDKCRMERVVLLLCNGACLINNTKKNIHTHTHTYTHIHTHTYIDKAFAKFTKQLDKIKEMN